MDKIEYKMISDDYHKDFNTFTLKKGETYFLLGKNGIGKSTLIKYFANKDRDKYYDIEFEIVVTKEAIRDYFKDSLLAPEALDSLVASWKEDKISVSYNTLHKKEYDEFEKIKSYVVTHIAKANKTILVSELKKLSNTVNKVLSKINEEKTSYEEELNKKIELKAIEVSDARKSDRYKNNINNLVEITKALEINLERVDRLIDAVPKNEDIDYKDLPGMGNYYFQVPSNLKDDVDQIRDANSNVSRLFMNRDGTNSFYFDDLLYSVLINLGIYVNLNDRYGRYSYDNNDKALSRGQVVMKTIGKVASEARERKYQTGYTFDEPFNSLDSKNIERARKKLDSIEGTKLITSHNTNAIKATDLKNVIVMFDYKDKKGIANYTDLKNLSKDDRFDITEVSDQVNAIFNNWFSKYKGNVLIVEGYKDYAILNERLDGIEVIPMGGAYLISGAISYYATKTDKIRFLFDKDDAGNRAASAVAINLPNGNITKKVFRRSKMKNFEELITNEEFGDDKVLKNKMFRGIIDGMYEEKVNEIVKIIKEQFKK